MHLAILYCVFSHYYSITIDSISVKQRSRKIEKTSDTESEKTSDTESASEQRSRKRGRTSDTKSDSVGTYVQS